MAIEAVEDLVTRSREVEERLNEACSQLSKLKEDHEDFWKKIRQECGHLYTKKQIDQARKKFLVRKPSLCWEWEATTGRITNDELNLACGYVCPYCMTSIEGIAVELHPADMTMRDWDAPEEKEERIFNLWVSQDTSNWPKDKKVLLENVKKEREEYLAKRKEMEQTIESLTSEYTTLRGQLEDLWNLLDKALGKDVEREQERKARLLKELREASSEYPYDPDEPSGYFAWQRYH